MLRRSFDGEPFECRAQFVDFVDIVAREPRNARAAVALESK
jgi:hypothetical protein